MKKQYNYVVTGITEEQLNIWKDSMREDLTIIVKDDIKVPVIKLTKFNAFKMRLQIIGNNMKNCYRFGLARI